MNMVMIKVHILGGGRNPDFFHLFLVSFAELALRLGSNRALIINFIDMGFEQKW